MSDEPKPTIEKPENSVDLEKQPSLDPPHPIDPLATTTDHPDRPWLRQSEPGNKKPLLILGLIVGALVVAGLVAWAVYALWFQNPDKVLGDALLNSMRSQALTETGVLTYKNKSYNLAMNLDGSFSYKDGGSFSSDLNFKKPDDSSVFSVKLGGVLATTGDTYVKISNYKQAMDAILQFILESSVGKENVDKIPPGILGQIKTRYEARLQTVAQMIDGKWIKLSPEDMNKLFNTSSKEFTCTQKFLQNLPGDNQGISELTTQYQKNRVLKITKNLGVKNGDIGYVVEVDQDATKRFVEGMKSTKVFDELQSCIGPIDPSKNDGSVDTSIPVKPTYSFDVWINQWNHQFTAVKGTLTGPINGDVTKITMDMKPKFNQSVQANAPADAVSFKDLSNELNKALGSNKDMSLPDFDTLSNVNKM